MPLPYLPECVLLLNCSHFDFIYFMHAFFFYIYNSVLFSLFLSMYISPLWDDQRTSDSSDVLIGDVVVALSF